MIKRDVNHTLEHYLLFLPIAEDFILEDPKHYNFLTCGKMQLPGIDEVAEFQATVKAMQIMGMNNDDIQCEFFSYSVFVGNFE